jgi:hypothetical protein
MKSMSWDIK